MTAIRTFSIYPKSSNTAVYQGAQFPNGTVAIATHVNGYIETYPTLRVLQEVDWMQRGQRVVFYDEIPPVEEFFTSELIEAVSRAVSIGRVSLDVEAGDHPIGKLEYDVYADLEFRPVQ